MEVTASPPSNRALSVSPSRTAHPLVHSKAETKYTTGQDGCEWPPYAFEHCVHCLNVNSHLLARQQSSTGHTYKFTVGMTCGGCSGAVQRVLSKMQGRDNSSTGSSADLADTTSTGLEVEKVEWETKEVVVHTKTDTPTYEEVEAKIAKTGVGCNSCKERERAH
jgi:copper chaperone CopZ